MARQVLYLLRIGAGMNIEERAQELERRNEQLLAFVKRYRDLGDFNQQGMDEINQEVDDWLEENEERV